MSATVISSNGSQLAVYQKLIKSIRGNRKEVCESVAGHTQGDCVEEERKALLEIKASHMKSYDSEIDKFLPTWVDYGSGTPGDGGNNCCDWERINCSTTTGHVTELSLYNLRGAKDVYMDDENKLWPLNVSLFLHFKELTSLNLSDNFLDKEFIKTGLERLSSLKKLEVLDLSWNYDIDNGILPSLRTLTSLKVLDLSFTSLNGNFPIKFAALENLEMLDLSSCGFNGTFEVQGSERVSVLRKLKTLNLAGNRFNESIIRSLNTLSSLTSLDLSHSLMSGPFPAQEFAALENLEMLDLSHCGFNGTFEIQGSERVSILRKLKTLNLAHNRFNESIIRSLNTLSSLTSLDLSDNSMSGPFPAQEQKITTTDATTDNPSYPRWVSNDAHDKDLVMLTISGLRDEYNGLKSNLLAHHPPSTFSDLHVVPDLISTDPSPSPTPLPTAPTSQSPPPPPPPPRSRPPNLRQNPKRKIPFDPSTYTSTRVSPSLSEPTSFTVANKSPEWRLAMNEEFQALQNNGTWSLVPYVKNTNLVDCKWVYRVKTDPQGNVTRYKARLVAKGFHQQPGVDYHETFSPVIKSTTIWVILSLVVANKWDVHQLNVKNAFLHGDLQETVYMKQLPGFVDPTKPDHVCLLHKSLYGLKQAPRAWFTRLSTVLLQLGFLGSKIDPSLFILNSGGTLAYVLVYVDDIIITGNNQAAISSIINRLNSSFAIKDLGPLHYFLGIEVVHHQQNIVLSQRKYILEILQRSGLSDCKPACSPISSSQSMTTDDSSPLLDPTTYRQTVGALQYVTLSRPDIAFAVNRVCQFMHAPTENHWSAVKRILRYLKGTTDLGLLIRHQSSSSLQAFTDAHWQDLASSPVQAYSDSDWVGCPVDRRSTGGFAIYLGSNLVSWTVRKQKTVSRSSTESEYKALVDTAAELIWLKAFLRELGISVTSPPILWCDNLRATYLSANPVFHARTKHVEVDFHFVREQVARGQLNVQFISTSDQIADVFTKPLSSQRFQFLRSKLQVVSCPQLAGE
uniref:Reverse transcriptase Ty1/copia-type domain-containing protein n=1 Tax=Lactuca sativa TaxID=4236 RepID=A0A9R1WIA3_LACSA|nr:hypothetical protein LSAT_V11C100013840 [Lactuca sativa]